MGCLNGLLVFVCDAVAHSFLALFCVTDCNEFGDEDVGVTVSTVVLLAFELAELDDEEPLLYVNSFKRNSKRSLS